MAVDFATLSLKVDHSDVKNASAAMSDMTKTGAALEGCWPSRS